MGVEMAQGIGGQLHEQDAISLSLSEGVPELLVLDKPLAVGGH